MDCLLPSLADAVKAAPGLAITGFDLVGYVRAGIVSIHANRIPCQVNPQLALELRQDSFHLLLATLFLCDA
jgi:hypothetical protein